MFFGPWALTLQLAAIFNFVADFPFGRTVIKTSITFTIAPRVPLTELSLRVGCISNLRSTMVFKINCILSCSAGATEHSPYVAYVLDISTSYNLSQRKVHK